MSSQINAYPKGKWGQMESEWAAQLKARNNVQVRIEPIYTDSSMRASSFKVTELINGKERSKEIFNQ